MTTQASSARWRQFADVTAIALGVNLWASMVLLPALFVHGLRDGSHIFSSVVPLILLLYGVWRRNEVVLLLAFPSTLLLPIAIVPAMASAQVYGPARFVIVGIGLVAFLFGASVLTSFHEPPPPRNIRPLKSSTVAMPRRWQRRRRLYASLSAIALIYPLCLLWAINFDDAGAAALAESYPGRTATFTTLLNVLAIGLWVFLFSTFLLGALKHHRTGDLLLQRRLNHLRQRAKRGSPRLVFYVGGLMAFVFMALWFVWRG